jgi:hypothetical protein
VKAVEDAMHTAESWDLAGDGVAGSGDAQTDFASAARWPTNH